MAKSGKRKSSKKQGTGQTLSALALIIAIGALGLGVYHFIAPPEGPTIYVNEYDDIIFLDGISYIEYLYPLNITYTTKVGDSVELEFSCRLYLDPVGQTTLSVHFDNNITYPSSSIYLNADSNIVTSGYMRHTFDATTAGENYLVIYAYIDDEGTNSYIRDSLLTVTVYG